MENGRYKAKRDMHRFSHSLQDMRSPQMMSEGSIYIINEERVSGVHFSFFALQLTIGFKMSSV